MDLWILTFIFHTVQHKLVQYKKDPLFIGIRKIRAHHFPAHSVTNQIILIFHQNFRSRLPKVCLFDHIVFVYLFHSGIIQNHIYVIFNPLILKTDLSGHFVFMILTRKLDTGNRCFDLMHPAFDIIPIIILFIFKHTDPFDHRFIRSSDQLPVDPIFQIW